MFSDIVQAWRGLRRSPGFSLTATLTMAIGIGAVTGIFSVVNATLLRPLPVPDADRVIVVTPVREDGAERSQTVSLNELADWRAQSRTVAAFGAFRDWGLIWRDADRRESIPADIATPELFDVLRVRPALGRLFRRDEDVPGRNTAVVISDAFWRARFGGRADALGKTMVLEGDGMATYTIVGVLPPDFDLPSFKGIQLWALSSTDPDAGLRRGLRNRRVFARLRDGVTIEEAATEMRVLAARLASQYPDSNRGWTIGVKSLLDGEMKEQGPALRAFLLAVTFVLLVACANVATLLLARAFSRRGEFAIRRALGGGGGSVVRALLAESLLLAGAGGVIGLALAGWLVRAILAFGPSIPRAETVPFEVGVFVFTFAVCALSTLLLALPAALLMTRVDPAAALKEESAQVAHMPALRFRLGLVAGEVAVALVLVAGAIVAAETLVRILDRPLGFNPNGLTMTFLVPPEGRYNGVQVAALYARLADEVRHVPGVTGASAVSGGPLTLGGAETTLFHVEGGPPEGNARPTSRYFNVLPGYFRTLGLTLRGRDFSERDTREADHVTIVNETFARRFLSGRDPLGARLRIVPGGNVVTVIGVAGDVLPEMGAHAQPTPEMYWPYSQQARFATLLVIRSDAGVATTRAALARVHAVDPEIQAGTPRTMEDRVAGLLKSPRTTLMLLGLFAATGLVLSAVGIYGLVAYSIRQRTREIGIRVSLGATPRDVLRAIGRSGMAAVVAGSLAGLAGTFAVSRVLAALLPGLEPLGVPQVGLAWALMVGVGLAACYVPARRAARIDPAVVLRAQ